MNIELLKKLRKATGAGISICKDALVSAKDNYEKAVEFVMQALKKESLKKEKNEAAEQGVYSVKKGNAVAVALVAVQTDFVLTSAKLSDFMFEQLNKMIDSNKTSLKDIDDFEENLSVITGVIGEKIVVLKSILFQNTEGNNYTCYFHGSLNPAYLQDEARLSKSAAIINSSEGNKEILKKLAAHACAKKPTSLNDPDVKGEEPTAFYNQTFFFDESILVKDLLQKENIEIKNFILV